MKPIRFEPPAFEAGKERVRKIQTNCLGFHAPETKNLCGECVIAAILLAAKTERERCALYLEKLNLQSIADQLRALE